MTPHRNLASRPMTIEVAPTGRRIGRRWRWQIRHAQADQRGHDGLVRQGTAHSRASAVRQAGRAAGVLIAELAMGSGPFGGGRPRCHIGTVDQPDATTGRPPRPHRTRRPRPLDMPAGRPNLRVIPGGRSTG